MSHQVYRTLGKFGSNCLAGSTRGYSKALFASPIKSQTYVARSCHPQVVPCASLSTSKKDRDTIATTTPPKTEHDPATVTGTQKKYWVSRGFDWESEDRDRNYANGLMFFSVTIGMVLTGFVLAYWPDHRLRDWSQREAYIELARREALGLPFVDPNVVPPEKINLPSEEELEDFDVVV